MIKLLEQAIASLQTLPASEQDAIAAMILEELEDGCSVSKLTLLHLFTRQ